MTMGQTAGIKCLNLSIIMLTGKHLRHSSHFPVNEDINICLFKFHQNGFYGSMVFMAFEHFILRMIETRK